MDINFLFITYCFLLLCSIFKNKPGLSNAVMRYDGELNANCRNVKDCRAFGYECNVNHTCQCAEMYIPNGEQKQCVGGVDQKCLYDEHCVRGAYCMNQSVCKCKQSSPVALNFGLVCSRGFVLTNNYNSISITIILLALSSI